MNSQSGTSSGALPLPKGGGSTRGLGDAFTPDLNRGTGSYAVEIDLPDGHRNLKPQLTLSYNSANGDGPYGFGWALPLSRIQIDTDVGAAAYLDPVYLLDGENLEEMEDGTYRHKVENAFHRVRRNGAAWEITDRRGNVTRLGGSPDSRISGEIAGDERTFAWLVDRVRDPSGNEMRYEYLRDGGELYIKRITYAAFAVQFEYEERHDVFTNRRPGFPVVRRLRCRTVEVSRPASDAPLIRRYLLHFAEDEELPSLLERVTMEGFKRQPDGSIQSNEAQAVEMDYTPFDPTKRRLRPIAVDGPAPPGSLGRQDFSLVDVGGDGLPDVVQMGGGRTRVWRNRGEGRFGPPRPLNDLPGSSNAATLFLDADGNGAVDIMDLRSGQARVYLNRSDGRFDRPRALGRKGRPLGFNPAEPNTAVADVTGNGRVDLVQTTAHGLVTWANRGSAEFALPTVTPRNRSRDALPDVRISDPRVFVADMTGDDLPDIVHITSGLIEYWPGLGGGRYDSRRTPARSPLLPRHYDPARLFLADVDGTGTADVVYVGTGEVSIWRNINGERFADPIIVRGTPYAPAGAIQLVDLLGTGNVGVLWTEIRHGRGTGYRYLSLTDIKPYLLTRIREGTGLETQIDYDASTAHAARDSRNGESWSTRLPMPVPVVRRIIRHDRVSGVADTTDISYHDGRWDSTTRRFRGFGRVTTHRLAGPGGNPSCEEHAYLVGAPGEPGLATSSELDERKADRARRGQVYRSAYYNGLPDETPLRVEETHWQVTAPEQNVDGEPILFPQVAKTIVRNHEGGDRPRVTTTEYEYDEFGNVTREWRQGSAPNGDDAGNSIEPLVAVTEVEYAVNLERYVVDRTARVVRRDENGNVLAEMRHYYDGEAFEGLPLGEVEAGLLVRQEEMVLSEDRAADLYGSDEPDWEALGYHHATRVDGKPMLAVNQARYDHSPHGMVSRQRDPLGHETLYEYDDDGLLVVGMTNAEGHKESAAWDPSWQLIEDRSDVAGETTRYTYDGIGRLRTIVRPGDSDALPTLEYTYEDERLPHGLRVIQRRRSGEEDVYEKAVYHDASGNPIQERSMLDENRVRISGPVSFDPRGEPVSKGQPSFGSGLAYEPLEPPAKGEVYHYHYDGIGRLVAADAPAGNSYEVDYTPWSATHRGRLEEDPGEDESGDRQSTTGAEGPRVKHFDPLGRLVAVSDTDDDGNDRRATYTYDLLGRLVASTDPQGQPGFRAIEYDSAGHKLRVDHATAGVRLFLYDARGRIVRSWDDRNQPVQRHYDNLGRPLEVEIEGEVVERFHWDEQAQGQGRLARVEDAGGTVNFTYDARGAVVAKDRTINAETYTIGYDYDAAGRLQRLTYPNGAEAVFERWGDGRVRRVEGLVEELRFDAIGHLTEIDHANGVRERLAYEGGGRLASIEVTTEQETLYEASLAYGPSGRLKTLQATDPGGGTRVERYRHNNMGFLVEAEQETDGAVEQWTYAYDAAGNLHRSDEEGIDHYEYDFDRVGALVGLASDGGSDDDNSELSPVAFDVAGHLTGMDGMSLEYDARGRLVRVRKEDGTIVEMTYDYRGERIAKEVRKPDGGTHETRTVDELYEDRAGIGTGYVMVAGRLVGHLRGNGRRHLHTDVRGSVILVTRPDGTVDGRAWFGPYGAASADSGSSPSRGYTGAFFDPETELFYLNARYYSPRLGRFLSPDPLYLGQPERALATPIALNLYAYAASDPVEYTDLTGMSFWSSVGKVLAGIVVAAATVAAIMLAVSLLTSTGIGVLLLGAALGAIIGGVTGGLSGSGWLEGAVMGAMMGVTMGVNIAVAGPALGVILGLVHVMGFVPGVRGQGWYKSVAGWSSWFAPASWPGHILGLGVFLGNGIAHVFGSSNQIEDVKFDWRHGQIQSVGGEFGEGPFEVAPEWMGVRMGAPAHNVGAFSFFRDDSKFNTKIIEHETGHMLSNFTFGFWQGAINPVQTSVLGRSHADSLFERIAESNVNESDRQPYGDETPFWA